MRRSLAAAALALSLGSAGCVHGRGTPQEPLVDAVVFKGVKSVDEDVLAEGLATSGPMARSGLSGNIIKERQRFEQDALPADIQRIKAFYSDVRTEMKKVTSPARKEVQGTTTVVIITVFLFAFYFWVVDLAISSSLDRMLHYFSHR